MSSFRKVIKISKYVVFAIIFSVTLSGCSLTGKKKAAVDPNTSKVVVWSFEDEDIWKPIKQDFEAQNKGLTLVYEKQVFDSNYENRLLNSLLSTRKPDVWAMPSDWVYRHKEKLYPMDEKTAAALKIDDTYVKSIKQSVYFDGKIYALAPSAEPLMIYYNPELFRSTLQQIENSETQSQEYIRKAEALLEAPPKTWTDFTEATKLLTKKNGSNIETAGVALGTDKVSNAQDILYLLMMQNETQILPENLNLATFNLPRQTSTGSNDQPGQRALEFYTSFANPGSPNYSWNDSLGNDVEAFVNGKAAMIFGYSSLQNYILQKYPTSPVQYEKAFAPQVSQEAGKITDYARFTVYGAGLYSMNPTAAWRLVNLIADSYSSTLSSANRLQTSQKSSSYDININNRVRGNPEQLSLATANSLVKGRYPIDFDNQIKAAIASVNAGRQDSRAALDVAANNISGLLRKTGW